MTELSPACAAFDAIAPIFDSRYGAWKSVEAQRRAVRRALVAAFPEGGDILEIGGGTGEDAQWLARRGYRLMLTDAPPTMVDLARVNLAPLGGRAEAVAAEKLEDFARRHHRDGGALFDGAFSNFAPLNCLDDLGPVARGLARLLKPGGSLMLVVFGIIAPGDILVETLRGRPHQALRRFRRGPAPARLGGRHFQVTYHRGADLTGALHPWFRPVRKIGIGIFVPPSAAEPWITSHPRLLRILEALDRAAGRPLAVLGDHILYQFERTATQTDD